jgi:Sulfotransferase family
MGDPEPTQAFIVGAQRCGTTSVAAALGRHPQVALAQPLRPEPKAFLQPGAGASVAGYLERFYGEVSAEVRVRLEKSTSYLDSAVARDEVARAFPDARIVVVVRDPVARAASHYAFSVANGLEDLPPEEALRAEAEIRPFTADEVSTSPFAYVSRGRYAEQLAPWDETFAVHVVVLEELVAEPGRFAELEAFLGVDHRVCFDPHERRNQGDPPELPEAVRRRLAEGYAEPNAALARRLGRPLDRWTSS